MIHQLIPENSPEIEKALLVRLLHSEAAVDEVISTATPEIFYRDENKAVYGLITQMYTKGKPIDFYTLSQAANDETKAYLTNLISDSTIMFANGTLSEYIDILKEKTIQRNAINLVYRLHQGLANGSGGEHAFQELEKAYLEASEIVHGKTRLLPLVEIIKDSLSKMQERIEARKKGTLPGIDTGFRALNKMAAGWQPGDLIVIAGRPAMGKTAVALHFAQAAAKSGKAVLFFSLEMANWRVADRLIIGASQVNPWGYAHGAIDQQENDAVFAGAAKISNLPIFIDEASGIDIHYIISNARQAVRKHGVELLIIDYLQLINMGQSRNQTRDQAIGEVTRRLKQLAKELNIPILLLSQLNRALEARSSKVPTLADLRESGNIEQDADMILMLFRPAVYGMDTYNDRPTRNVLWLHTEKFRNGSAHDLIVEHNTTLTVFSDYEPDSK